VQEKEGVGGGDLQSSPFPWFFSARLPLFQWAPWFCFPNPTKPFYIFLFEVGNGVNATKWSLKLVYGQAF
jgi:hypothetical protein